MRIFKEITDWPEVEYDVKNHSYAVNDAGKCVGYCKSGTTEWIFFKKPKFFDRARRKFIQLKSGNIFNLFHENYVQY
jgi:hypothetical protein